MKAWFKRWFKGLKKTQGAAVTYFVHVPKTAGTSFIVLLDRFFHATKVFPYQLWREIKEINQQENNQYNLFRGHFGGGGLNVLTERPVEYLTILRDPIELARSTYQYVLREENTKVHDIVSQTQMSFEEFLNHEQTQPLIKNRMIRNISFDFKEDPAAQEVFLSEETIEYLQSVMSQSRSSLNDDDRLNRAKEFLCSCRWFGLQEAFDRSMQLLCFEMHWPPIGPSPKLNVVDQKSTITDDEIDTLKQVNQQDMSFYQFAQQIFEKRYAEMERALEDLRSNREQSIDELIDLSYQNHCQLELKTYIRYGFDEVLLGSQWHRREMMQPEKQFFRWTGPGTNSTLDFWLKPQVYEIKIRIINAISIDMLNGLVIKLNGQTLKWQKEGQDVVRVLTMHCSADSIQKNGLARISLHTQGVETHALAFNSDDQRLVGIAVHWIQFKHV